MSFLFYFLFYFFVHSLHIGQLNVSKSSVQIQALKAPETGMWTGEQDPNCIKFPETHELHTHALLSRR